MASHREDDALSRATSEAPQERYVLTLQRRHASMKTPNVIELDGQEGLGKELVIGRSRRHAQIVVDIPVADGRRGFVISRK